MDFTEIITACIGLVTSITTGIVSWVLARRKYNTEVDHNYLENIEKGLETYDSIINHNRNEIDYLAKENLELRAEIAELRKQVLNLTMNICMDLTCARRIREHQIIGRDRNGKNVSTLNETDVVDEKD